MRTLSPFPYKVELRNPNERIRWCEVTDHELIEYVSRVGVSWYNPLTKEFKKNVVNNWCNMVFTYRGWDFEEEFDNDLNCIQYLLCFRTEADATFFALKWA